MEIRGLSSRGLHLSDINFKFPPFTACIPERLYLNNQKDTILFSGKKYSISEYTGSAAGVPIYSRGLHFFASLALLGSLLGRMVRAWEGGRKVGSRVRGRTGSGAWDDGDPWTNLGPPWLRR